MFLRNDVFDDTVVRFPYPVGSFFIIIPLAISMTQAVLGVNFCKKIKMACVLRLSRDLEPRAHYSHYFPNHLFLSLLPINMMFKFDVWEAYAAFRYHRQLVIWYMKS